MSLKRTYDEAFIQNENSLVENKMVYRMNNEIYFSTGVNQRSIQEVIYCMMEVINEHIKKHGEDTTEELNIIYIVDSPGGSVTAILRFVDFLDLMREKHKFLKFTSVITGLVASAGTIMAIVADKRFMTKNAHAMVHELSSGNSGKYTELVSYGGFLRKLHDKLADIYVKKTGKTKKKVEKIMSKETWFTAEEYLSYGFIDEIKCLEK